MEKLFKFLFFFLMFCAPQAFAQSIVTGEVVDEKSEPLIGATVMVKGTSTGTSTDIDGKFSLAAKTGDVLEVSYVGYESKAVKVPESGKLRITLTEISTGLDEVVVVGVSMKKSDLTGAVSQIDGDVLTEKPVTTVNDALAGRMPGVSIGKASSPSESNSIKIRGTNTINAGSSPIYVVDGLVMGDDYGSFNSINVNDVESIQVLKDASATALYGSRGANGVVVITTKKARVGEGKVTYDGWVKFTEPGHSPDLMDANGIWNLRTEAFANGYMYGNPNADRDAYIKDYIWNEDSPLAFERREFLTHRLGKSYNWLDQVTRLGLANLMLCIDNQVVDIALPVVYTLRTRQCFNVLRHFSSDSANLIIFRDVHAILNVKVSAIGISTLAVIVLSNLNYFVSFEISMLV